MRNILTIIKDLITFTAGVILLWCISVDDNISMNDIPCPYDLGQIMIVCIWILVLLILLPAIVKVICELDDIKKGIKRVN